MANVLCDVEEVILENDRGVEVESVCVTCGQCGHETESFGRTDASISRCFALLREECPEGGRNFYEQG
jgi:hypothetical protein